MKEIKTEVVIASENNEAHNSRRHIVKGTLLAAGGVAALPSTWTKPVVDTLLLPAHAQTTMMSIVEIALASANFTTLVGALVSADLVDTLAGPGPFTVFAPVNDAFAAISATVASLTPEQLKTVLLYHVLSGNLPASAIPATTGATASVIATVQASNGVIHVVDQVLLP